MAIQESILRILIDSRNAERNANSLNRELRSIERNGDFATTSMDSMSKASRSLAASLASVVTVGTAIAKVDAYTNLQNRLKLVTNSQEQLNQAMTDTFQIAQNTAAAWDSTAMVYQRFAANSEKLGINLSQVAGLTETVAKAIAVSGASASSAEAALMQFGQSLASGVFRGEEFNSVAEQAPALLKAIADGLDVDIGRLRQMAQAGEITADVLVTSLTKAEESVDELFNKTDFTIANEFTRLSNSVTQFVGESNKGTGAASALGAAIRALSENLSTIADAALIGGVALLTKAIVTKTVALTASTSAAIADRVANIALAQSNLATATAAQAQARSELAAAAAMARSMGATTAQTAAMVANARAKYQAAAANVALAQSQVAANAASSLGARALASLTSPVGLLTIAATALAVGYVAIKNRAAEATAELERQTAVASKTTEELKALKGAQLDAAKDDLKNAFEGQNEALRMSNKAFNDWVKEVRNANKYSYEFEEIAGKIEDGLISQSDALEQINKLDFLTPEQRKQGLEAVNNAIMQREKTLQVAEANKTMGREVKLAGNAADIAAAQQRNQANALDQVANAAGNAKNALSSYLTEMQKTAMTDFNAVGYMNQGFTPSQAKVVADLWANAADGQIVSQEQIDQALNMLSISEQRSSAEKAYGDRIKDATKAAKDQAKEMENLRKEAQQLRETISESYLTDFERFSNDQAKALGDLSKAGFGSADEAKYRKLITDRYSFEQDQYLFNLSTQYNEFKWTEEQKLTETYKFNKRNLDLRTDLTKELRDLEDKWLDEKYKQEVYAIRITNAERILEAQKSFITETEYNDRKYELEISAYRNMVDQKEAADLEQAAAQRRLVEESRKFYEKYERIDADYNAMTADLNPMSEQDILSAQLAERQRIIDEAYAIERIGAEEHSSRMLEVQQAYQLASDTLRLSMFETTVGGWAEMFKTLYGEQSTAYRNMFFLERAFAISKALLNVRTSYSDAYNAVVGTPIIGPYIAPAIGAAAAALQVAQATQLRSVNMSGFKTGGYTGNMGVNEVAGVVHGQEYVVNAEATKRIGVDTLQAIESGRMPASSASGSANVTLNPNFVIVDERENLSDYLFNNPDGKKAFVKFMKQNRTELGL